MDLQNRLDLQRNLHPGAWGHIVPERWDAVVQNMGQSVLDVGCATGIYGKLLSDRGIKNIGMDMLTYPEWKMLPGKFLIADARTLPVADKSFDTIIAFETLEHVPDPERALREFYRVCRKNIIISVPNCEVIPEFQRANLAFNHWTDRSHVNFFTVPTLKAMVESIGFRVNKVEPIKPAIPELIAMTSFGLPMRMASVLSRWLKFIRVKRYYMSLLLIAEKPA